MKPKPEREWWVKVNLDDLSDSLDQLDSTEERGQWLEGFRIGSRGHERREGWSVYKSIGFEFGAKCSNETKKFRGSQSEKGKKSADARNNPTEVQPDGQPKFNRKSTEVQPDGQPKFNQPTTNNQQRTTNNEQHPPP